MEEVLADHYVDRYGLGTVRKIPRFSGDLRCHIALCYTYPTHRMITWRAADWATQYGCGENNVVDLNVSDAYWPLYAGGSRS